MTTLTPYLQDPDVTIYHGEALTVLRDARGVAVVWREVAGKLAKALTTATAGSNRDDDDWHIRHRRNGERDAEDCLICVAGSALRRHEEHALRQYGEEFGGQSILLPPGHLTFEDGD